MCRTPRIDTEKGKWEKVILSLLWSLRDLNTSIPLPRKLNAASPCPELFRSYLNCRPSLKKPMDQLPFLLAVLTPPLTFPGEQLPHLLSDSRGKLIVPLPTKCLSWLCWCGEDREGNKKNREAGIELWTPGRVWVECWARAPESWAKGAQEQGQSLRRATWAPADGSSCCHLFTRYCC